MKNATIDNIKYITYNSCVDVLVFFYTIQATSCRLGM